MKTILLNAAISAMLLLPDGMLNARELLNVVKSGHPGTHPALGAKALEVSDCVPGATQYDMEINNVRARLLTGGDMWWDLSSLPEYEVPKGNGTNPLCSIFAGAIWISGLDAGGNLKCAAQRYRDTGNDFWPGPLDASGNVTQAVCAQYDRIFNVYGTDIAAAQLAYQTNGTSTSQGDIPNDVLSWPAIGNQFIATNPALLGSTFNVTDNTAPFFDNNGDGIYNPLDGDYPSIPCGTNQGTAYADQMSFCVFNDEGNIHTETNGVAIGVQIDRLAFEFSTTNDINNMSFYNYQIINRSANPLYQTYVSQWTDPDLGCFSNDYAGCDTTRNLGICYNGTADDPDCAPEYGYGTDLPAVGVEFFQGPLNDSMKEIGMSSFVYFTGQGAASAAVSDPVTAAQFRNYQTGYWADGTPFTARLDGYNSGGPPTKFIFPGDPSNSTAWSECQPATAALLAPGDRRFVESSGPFTLKPGIVESVTVGVPWLRPPGLGVGTCPDFNATIGPVADEALALFLSCFQLLNGPDAPTLEIRELANELDINLVNFKGSNNFGENYTQLSTTAEIAIDDFLDSVGNANYKFEGYLLYQVVSPNVSATNLSDPTQAVLIGESDIKDGVSTIINYVSDPVLGLVPTLEVTGADAGITSSYKITTDYLYGTVVSNIPTPNTTGSTNNQLINNTTYYYAAVAYAYNDYLPYNQVSPVSYAQLSPYLAGRGNFNVYSAVPHIPDPRDNGTVVNSVWGQGIAVTRIEGQGNGGNNLELNPATVLNILNSGFTAFSDSLTYVVSHDPIGFQVTDPIALIQGNFMLQMVDSLADTLGHIRDTLLGVNTSWRLIDLTHGDTIYSDRSLDRPYQQEIIYYPSPGDTLFNSQITDYGFSIKLGTPSLADTIPGNYLASASSPNRYVYGVDANQSAVEWADSTQQWLSFIASSGVNVVTDWIRSGSTLNDPTSNTMATAAAAYAFDDNWYYLGVTTPTYGGNNSAFLFDDPSSQFNNILGGTWGPYCLTPNYANANPTAPAPPYIYGPGFKWRGYDYTEYASPPPQNTLDQIASVDVVITPDKQYWSQCVVFETGEDEGVNEGANLYPRTVTGHTAPLNLLPNDGAFKGQIRMDYSQDWHNPSTRDYLQTVTADTGRSWFPGYAINVETGERLNIAFGESSDMGEQNGRDMLWDPTSNLYTPITGSNQFVPLIPYFGGKHFIYVMSSKYDAGVAAQQLLLRTYDSIGAVPPFNSLAIPPSVAPLYRSLMWTCIPYLTPGFSFQTDPGSSNPAYVPPSEVTFSIRVEKPYSRMLAVNPSPGEDSMPVYEFSTFGLGATVNNITVAKNALDEVKVVPNPYLAYSAYETTANTSTVYITNLPNNCTISIYSLDGTLINVLTRNIGSNQTVNQETSSGVYGNNTQIALGTSTSVSWDLTNTAGIPIASGIYLFHVEAPGIGQTTVKWFGSLRPDNITNY